ncbi:MAG: CHASE domain-containing protein [Cohaesibacteraceae bacterium]|nr:CHASE domain-containing protein [Cohaesibacteraceae bacterium]
MTENNTDKITNNKFTFTMFLPVIAIACIGLFFTWAVWSFVHNADRNQKQVALNSMGLAHAKTLEINLKKSLNFLRSIRGLYDSAGTVSRAGFAKYVSSLETDATVQALEWIPRVRSKDRKAHEDAAIAEGITGYEIRERSPEGKMTSAKPRSVYFPVYYVQPFIGNQKAVGFDLGSSPARLAALQQAQDSGRIVLTRKITLVQERGTQSGFLAFEPIYKNGVIPLDTASRRQNLKGFALGVFRVGDLIASVKHHHHTGKLFLIDRTNPSSPEVLYPTELSEKDIHKAVESVGWSFKLPIDIPGRNWEILLVPEFGSAYFDSPMHVTGTLIIGILLTLILTIYSLNAVLHSAKAGAIVIQSAFDLDKTQASLEAAREQLKHMESYDTLTGFPNRGQFDDRLSHTIEVASRKKEDVILLLVKLAQIKEIGEKLGYQFGDNVLKEASIRLKGCTRKADLVARVGADEFCVVMKSGTTLSGASVLAAKIGAMMEEPMHEFGEVTPGCNIGIAGFPQQADSAHGLFNCADTAMYEALAEDAIFKVFGNDDGTAVNEQFEKAQEDTSISMADKLAEEEQNEAVNNALHSVK